MIYFYGVFLTADTGTETLNSHCSFIGCKICECIFYENQIPQKYCKWSEYLSMTNHSICRIWNCIVTLFGNRYITNIVCNFWGDLSTVPLIYNSICMYWSHQSIDFFYTLQNWIVAEYICRVLHCICTTALCHSFNRVDLQFLLNCVIIQYNFQYDPTLLQMANLGNRT